MTQTQKSCEERIDEHMKDRIKDIEEVIAQYDKGEPIKTSDDPDYEYEDLLEWLNSYSLAFEDDSHYRAKKLELSTGGPADGFRFFEDGTIEYYFQDWYDGAVREVRNEAVKNLAEYLSEF